ncbi:MAG: M48 family metalloprotease [Alphaproteobacteria bacterium]
MAQYTDFFSTAMIEELQIQPHGQHPQLENWLQSIVQRLYDALPPEKRTGTLAACPPVFLSASSTIHSSIGGSSTSILLSVGLLKLPESEDELAGILGHEFLHPITDAELLYFNAILPNSAVDKKITVPQNM